MALRLLCWTFPALMPVAIWAAAAQPKANRIIECERALSKLRAVLTSSSLSDLKRPSRIGNSHSRISSNPLSSKRELQLLNTELVAADQDLVASFHCSTLAGAYLAALINDNWIGSFACHSVFISVLC